MTIRQILASGDIAHTPVAQAGPDGPALPADSIGPLTFARHSMRAGGLARFRVEAPRPGHRRRRDHHWQIATL